jgi:hypothetical protein
MQKPIKFKRLNQIVSKLYGGGEKWVLKYSSQLPH